MKTFGILLLTLWSFAAFADIELVTPISSEREDGLDQAQDSVFVDTDGVVSWYVKEKGFVPGKNVAPTAIAKKPAPGKSPSKVAAKNQKSQMRKLASDGKKQKVKKPRLKKTPKRKRP